MARKTIKELEAELAASQAATVAAETKNVELVAEMEALPTLVETPKASDIMTGDEVDLAIENAELKALLAKNTAHTNESESRLMSMINAMEEAGGDTGACLTFTPDEYRAHSAASGRIMGRLPSQKTKCTIEELRAAINSDKTPSWLMEKHGMTEFDLQQLIWKLSTQELRDKPIKLNFKRDFFGKEA